MKKLLLILCVFTIMGCSKTIEEQEVALVEAKKKAKLETTKDQRRAQEMLDYSNVVTRDGCQYLLYWVRFDRGGVSSLTHKGDCNNSIHKH